MPALGALLEAITRDASSADLVEAQDRDGWRALHHAASRGNAPAVVMLLAAHAAADPLTRSGATPLMLAVQNGDLDTITALAERSHDINRQNPGGETALYLAAAAGQIDAAKLLLAKGADPNLARRDGRTPLAAATASGDQEVAGCTMELALEIHSRKTAIQHQCLERHRESGRPNSGGREFHFAA